MPITVLGGTTSAAGAFEVANSVRMNGDARMYITPSAGDADKWTFSCWVKRSVISSGSQTLISAKDGSNYMTEIRFNSDDTIDFYSEDGASGFNGRLNTSRKFRDVSAWYHVVAVWDSENGTAGNRMRLYINGVEETSFETDTNPDQNTDSWAYDGKVLQIGRDGRDQGFFDGYMAEVVFIDGLALTPTSFGEFDSDSPTIWKPIDVSGFTFGNNGFYLDFEDSSALGNDVSGNNNDFTATNLAAIDQCNDSPTNNFCTMNPLENYIPAHTFSQGNNTIATTDASETYTMSTFGVTKGKWYFEALLDGTTYSEFSQIGVASTKGPAAGDYLGDTQTGYGYDNTGNYRKNDDDSIDIVSYGDTFTGDDIIGVYLDLDNSKLYFGKNGTIQNSGTGISITAAASALITGTYFFCVGDRQADDAIWHCNFGNGSFSETAMSSGNADANGYGNFEYDPSAGGASSFDSAAKNFLAICSKNLGSDGG